jgi:PilZ domain
LARPEPIPTPFQIALGVLGQLPCRVVVVTADGSRFHAEVLALEGECLRCRPSEGAQMLGETLTLVIGDGQRAGYEIDCVLASPQAGPSAQLAVLDVRRVKPRRRHARINVFESALVGPADTEAEVDVDVVDVGQDGLAFVSERRLAVGDLISGMLNLGQRAFPIGARVVHTQPLGFGRARVGCQFTRIAESDRRALGEIARRTPIDRRSLRPIEIVENEAARERARGSASLTNVQHHEQTVVMPTPHYCRSCSRVTLHCDTALPGHAQDWQCRICR